MARKKTSLAVLFADVSGSTRLYEALGDTAAFGQVRECLELLRSISNAFAGRVVKTIGDGAMCVFATADDAAHAAREMQLGVAQLRTEGSEKLMIRVGFHFGPVIQEGEDVFGDSVNVAARMSGLAGAGQVITTADTVRFLSAHLREVTRPLAPLAVKGKREEMKVHELLWQAGSDRTVVPGRTVASVRSGGPCVRLVHRGREIVVNDTAWFGRDADNTVVILDPMASRRHAKIELRGGKFVLVDQSSNGTFVTFGSDGEMRLRREELILHGAGVIAFGHSATQPGAETVEFRCELK